jgi:hypothetical protein
MDMRSGGSQKEEWPYIIIEAPIKEAKAIFYNRFGHDPTRVTCTCCGEDYLIKEAGSLEQLTTSSCAPFKKYLARGKCLVIRASEVKAKEREGYVPEQGYVWHE